MAFIGVSNQDTVEDGVSYQAEFAVPYELANAPEVWELYGNPFRPTTIVIAADGGIATQIDGPITPEGLREAIEVEL